MTLNGWIQILLYCGIVLLLVKPLGGYMTRVCSAASARCSRPCSARSSAASTASPASSEREDQHWTSLCRRHAALQPRGLSCCSTRCCGCRDLLPLNPPGMAAVAPELSFNTAVSFVTNTNWQNYGGESTMSYLAQMAGLTVQNFVSAATGIALAVALIRGFARASAKTIGNFWVDLTRSTLYVLLPLCIVLTLVFVCAGRAADARRLCRRDHARRRAADDRASGRSPRRSRSRCSAPTAAASSTPTPRIRSRTRRALEPDPDGVDLRASARR